MTIKEQFQLVKIRLCNTFIHLGRLDGKTQLAKDIRFLIGQTARAIELREENETLSATNNDARKEIRVPKNKLEVRHESIPSTRHTSL